TLLHAEDLPCALHLQSPDLADVLEDVRAIHLGIQDRTALTPGEGADQHVHAFRDIARHGGRALTRLVVGMRVNGHQPQRCTHGLDVSSMSVALGSPLASRTSCLDTPFASLARAAPPPGLKSL